MLYSGWRLELCSKPNDETYNYANVNNPKARDEVLKIIGELDFEKL